jgi:hypothetical protein
MEEVKTEQREKKVEFTLPKKKVTLKPVLDRTRGMVKDPNHAAAFLVGRSTRNISTPRLDRSHSLDFPLTEEERKFFENKEKSGLYFESGDLSPFTKNFKRDGSKGGNLSWWETKGARISLGKIDIEFDLSNPMEYLHYKILLKNKRLIARNPDELKYNPDALYVFEEVADVTRTKATKIAKKKAAYKALDVIDKNQGKMIDILTALGKRVSANQDLNFLQAALGEIIEEDVDKFLNVYEDEYFDEKVLIGRLLRARMIERKNSKYYLKDGSPLCERNEEAFIDNACSYLRSNENVELRGKLEADLEKTLKQTGKSKE